MNAERRASGFRPAMILPTLLLVAASALVWIALVAAGALVWMLIWHFSASVGAHAARRPEPCVFSCVPAATGNTE